MSTRSHIAYMHENGSLDVIYAHWDGYLTGNGKLLLENYDNEDKVRLLIAKGDVSSLGDTIDETAFYATRGSWEDSRGGSDEPWEQVKPKTFQSLADFRESLRESWTEFIYIFTNGYWRWQRTAAFRNGKTTHNLTPYMVNSED